MSTPNNHGARRKRISDETRAAILAADPSVSNRELARQFGCSDGGVLAIRRSAGIRSTATRGAQRGSGGRLRSPQSTTLPSRAKHSEIEGSAVVNREEPALSEPEASRTVTVVLNFSPEQLNAIWARFTPDIKSVAIAAALEWNALDL